MYEIAFSLQKGELGRWEGERSVSTRWQCGFVLCRFSSETSRWPAKMYSPRLNPRCPNSTPPNLPPHPSRPKEYQPVLPVKPGSVTVVHISIAQKSRLRLKRSTHKSKSAHWAKRLPNGHLQPSETGINCQSRAGTTLYLPKCKTLCPVSSHSARSGRQTSDVLATNYRHRTRTQEARNLAPFFRPEGGRYGRDFGCVSFPVRVGTARQRHAPVKGRG